MHPRPVPRPIASVELLVMLAIAGLRVEVATRDEDDAVREMDEVEGDMIATDLPVEIELQACSGLLILK